MGEEQEVLFKTDTQFEVLDIKVAENKVDLILKELTENGKSKFEGALENRGKQLAVEKNAAGDEHQGNNEEIRGEFGVIRGRSAIHDEVYNGKPRGNRGRIGEGSVPQNIGSNAEVGNDSNRKGLLQRVETGNDGVTEGQIEQVVERLSRAGAPEATRITDTANWYKGRIDGDDLFVIYSTEDANNPTILYEVKGRNARAELEALQSMLEVIENGNIRKQENISRLLGGDWVQEKYGMENNDAGLGERTGNTGYASVLQGKPSEIIGSAAFRNVIKNLLAIQKGVNLCVRPHR